MSNEAQSIVRIRWGIALLLLLLFGAGCLYLYHFSTCLDGCGPYHNRASVADLDSDGDLDIVLSNLRHETDTIVWAGATLWINQGGGKFTPRGGPFGGPYTTAGDVNGDGNVDLVRWANDAIQIHINYDEEDPKYGNFQVWYGIRPVEDLNDRSYTANASIALGDLNGDGRLDAFVSNWGASLIDQRDGFLPYVPWVWINTADENGYPKGVGLNLDSLGDLPMQPALGDLDGDGDLDVYAASLPPKRGNYDPSDRILLNDGSGAFVDSGQRLDNPRKAGTAGSGSVALGDLDGDGDLDAVVAIAKGASIWMNQGGTQGGQIGIFTKSGQRLSRGHIEAVFLGDFDANGTLDALVAGKAQATIWWNDGKGVFSRSDVHFKYKEDTGVAVGDFDGDGTPDIFIRVVQDYQVWFNDGKGGFKAGHQ